jgi:glutathione S-transferase
MVPLFLGLVRTAQDQRDPAAIKNALEKATNAWRIVEAQLARNHYLAGADFTLGDIPSGVWAYRWFNLPVERPEFPRLQNWYQRLCNRRPYQKHIMIPMT